MKCKMQDLPNNRILYFDYLRILASLAVMIIHISAQNWYSTSVTSFQWQTFNFFDSIARWSLPIFVMISGALFLDGNKSITEIYKKNILRIITAYIIWSTIYAVVASLGQGLSIKSVCKQVIEGPYHMWFLFMIVGLYMITPLVRKIVESQILTKYFLALALVFTFIFQQGIVIMYVADETIAYLASSIIQNINFHFTLGYIPYFILGYYLSKADISPEMRYIIYVLGILGFACTILSASYISIYMNEPNAVMYGDFTVNVMLQSLGMFVFFKYNVGPLKVSRKMQTVITRLSKYSFGAYLVHVMVIEQLNNIFGLNTMSFNPILSVIVITLITCVISYAISYICNHIPLLNKYIV